MDLINDINSIGLQWYQTLTGHPAAPPPPVQPAATPGTAQALIASNYTGIAIVVGVLGLVALLIYMLLK